MSSITTVALLVGIPGLRFGHDVVLFEMHGAGLVVVHVGEGLAAVVEHAVVITLFQLTRFTEAACPTFSGHVVTYLERGESSLYSASPRRPTRIAPPQVSGVGSNGTSTVPVGKVPVPVGVGDFLDWPAACWAVTAERPADWDHRARGDAPG